MYTLIYEILATSRWVEGVDGFRTKEDAEAYFEEVKQRALVPVNLLEIRIVEHRGGLRLPKEVLEFYVKRNRISELPFDQRRQAEKYMRKKLKIESVQVIENKENKQCE